MDGIFNCESVEKLKERIAKIEELAANGDGHAAFMLSFIYSPHSVIANHLKDAIGASAAKSLEYEKLAVRNTLQEVQLGVAEAMRRMAMFYQAGAADISQNIEECILWNERALRAGCVFAANDLYSIYSDRSSEYFNADDALRVLQILKENNCMVVELRDTDG